MHLVHCCPVNCHFCKSYNHCSWPLLLALNQCSRLLYERFIKTDIGFLYLHYTRNQHIQTFCLLEFPDTSLKLPWSAANSLFTTGVGHRQTLKWLGKHWTETRRYLTAIIALHVMTKITLETVLSGKWLLSHGINYLWRSDQIRSSEYIVTFKSLLKKYIHRSTWQQHVHFMKLASQKRLCDLMDELRCAIEHVMGLSP